MLNRTKTQTINGFGKCRLAFWPRVGGWPLSVATGILLASTFPSRAQEQKAESILIRPSEVKGDLVVNVDYDPVYQIEKRYRGNALTNFLKNQGIDLGGLPGNTLVVFNCSDGYKPLATLSQIIQDNAFLATSDEEAPSGRSWSPFVSHGTEHEPGPLYLVWPHVPKSDVSHPWPYGIESINIGITNDFFVLADPKAEAMRPGFLLFRQYCMSCHSMNGIGGTVGVELNLPRNVFEYWQKDMLLPYVANPASFRQNAKMPSFEHLGREALSQILKYVEYMGKHKGVGSSSIK